MQKHIRAFQGVQPGKELCRRDSEVGSLNAVAARKPSRVVVFDRKEGLVLVLVSQ